MYGGRPPLPKLPAVRPVRRRVPGRLGRPGAEATPCLVLGKSYRDHRGWLIGYGTGRQAHREAHPVESASQDAPGRPISVPADHDTLPVVTAVPVVAAARSAPLVRPDRGGGGLRRHGRP